MLNSALINSSSATEDCAALELERDESATELFDCVLDADESTELFFIAELLEKTELLDITELLVEFEFEVEFEVELVVEFIGDELRELAF